MSSIATPTKIQSSENSENSAPIKTLDSNSKYKLDIVVKSLFIDVEDSPETHIYVKGVVPIFSGTFQSSDTVMELKTQLFNYLISKDLIQNQSNNEKNEKEDEELLKLFLQNYALVNSTHKDRDVSTKLIGNRKFTIKNRTLNTKLNRHLNSGSVGVQLHRIKHNGTVLDDNLTLDSIPSNIYCNMDLNDIPTLTIFAAAKYHFGDATDESSSNTDNSSHSMVVITDPTNLLDIATHSTLKLNEHPASDNSMLIDSPRTDHSSSQTSADAVAANGSVMRTLNSKYSNASSSDNLLNIENVTSDIIKKKIKARFADFKIYTDFGPILIAVNPFRYLPIYNPRYMQKYSNDSRLLSPHIFSVAAKVYEKILTTQTNQCVVISGVSGSGKTESAKFLIQELLFMANSERESYIESITNAALQILEGFGNAVTENNDNASRFGLVTQFNYSKIGQLAETKFSHYLLEKSRVTQQSENDRNFHIFYYLESGLKMSTIENEYFLDKDVVFNYLSNETNEQKYAMNMHRTFKFKIVHRCFETLGLNYVEHQIFKILLAILYIGNVVIDLQSRDYAQSLANDPALKKIALLLMIDEKHLVQFFSSENITIKNERMNVKFPPEHAIHARDGLAKSLYVFVFDWLVRRINQLLASTLVPIQTNLRSILLLDIFGFENNKTNSFEQFCINYANEAMQNYVITSILQKEQDMYINEGIPVDAVDYTDSLKVLQMIAGKPVSIISIIVEESLLSMGSLSTMRQKVDAQFKSNSKYIQTNNQITFGITHYAGPVIYDLTDFRTKNLDRNYSAIVKLICRSENKDIKDIMLNFDARKQWRKIRCFFKVYYQLINFKRSDMMLVATSKGYVKRIMEQNMLRSAEHSDEEFTKIEFSTSSHSNAGSSKFTILSSFRDSLNKLLSMLNECESCYVYCVRSNKTKEEFVLDPDYLSTQLEYSGIFKGLNFLKNTYQNVFDFNDFMEQYPLFVIDPSKPIVNIKDLNDVFVYYKFEPKTYFVGKTKIFVMDSVIKKMAEISMNWYNRGIEQIEQWWETHTESLKFKSIRDNTFLLQKVSACLRIKQERELASLEHSQDSSMNKTDNSGNILTTEKFNQSKERLSSLFVPETITPNIDKAFKKLIYPSDENDTQQFSTDLTSVSDYEKLSSETTEKINSLAMADDHHVRHDSSDRRMNKICEKLTTSTSCIIDVDIMETLSDHADELRATKSENNKMNNVDEECEDTMSGDYESKMDRRNETLNRSFRNILNFNKKSKSKFKNKYEKDKSFISKNQSLHRKKKKSVKSFKSESQYQQRDNSSAISTQVSDNVCEIIADDHEGFYIFIKYVQQYAFANQTGSTFNESNNNLLSVFFTSLQRFTSVYHAIFVNAFRFSEPIHLSEIEAVKSFEDILQKTITEQESKFPVHMGTNSFHGLLRLFKNAPKSEITQLKKDFKRVRDSFDLSKSNITNEGHMMNCSNPLPGTNFCEVCNTLVWDDAYTCDYCHVVCHKRCIVRLSTLCTVQSGVTNNNKFFQIEINDFSTSQNSIPDKLIAMLQEIEKRCLHTEGIYRRPGNSAKLNNYKTILDTNAAEAIDFGEFEPLILASLVKLFFRQLPSPLFSRIISLELTNSGDIFEDIEALTRINQILSKVSRPNYFVLERLLAHLAAIAENEQVNKMTSYNLAIIFAPCLFDFESNASIAQIKLLDHQRRVIQLLIDTLGKNLLRV